MFAHSSQPQLGVLSAVAWITFEYASLGWQHSKKKVMCRCISPPSSTTPWASLFTATLALPLHVQCCFPQHLIVDNGMLFFKLLHSACTTFKVLFFKKKSKLLCLQGHYRPTGGYTPFKAVEKLLLKCIIKVSILRIHNPFPLVSTIADSSLHDHDAHHFQNRWYCYYASSHFLMRALTLKQRWAYSVVSCFFSCKRICWLVGAIFKLTELVWLPLILCLLSYRGARRHCFAFVFISLSSC